jgi:hypothetical protein
MAPRHHHPPSRATAPADVRAPARLAQARTDFAVQRTLTMGLLWVFGRPIAGLAPVLSEVLFGR